MRPILLTLLALAAAPLGAQEMARDVTEGADLYRFHCATCHGAGARGNGPMAPALIVPPADLTTLSSRNQGVFPVRRVVSRIDGRDPLVSHGSDMPVYGDFFEGEDVAVQAETGQPILTSRPVADLLAFLETIQRE